MPVNGKLGCKPARIDPRTLKMSRLALPKPPTRQIWCSAISDWGMMGNDQLGDCVFAAMGHAIQVWSRATGKELTLSDAAIVGAYSKWAGYVPWDPSTDNGAVELDMLNLWRQQDLGGEKLIGYADPSPANTLHVEQAVWLFGGLMIGLNLPITAQDQDTWDVVPGNSTDADPGSWGGHAVHVIGYDNRVLTFVTWGALKQMTWAFWQQYCSESHALLSARWLAGAPQEYRFLGDLQAELAGLS